MKKINPGGSKTLYVGGIYEVDKASGGSVTRTVTYYPVGGAMRINNTLYYILKDHLGSASVVTDANGVEVGEQRYYPFGETRLTTGTIYTDKLFTGQREMAGLGIYHYQARFYSPKLGRFLSPDTIVPGYGNPQNLNRYSYVANRPLNYTDPSGHTYICDEGCESYAGRRQYSLNDMADMYGISFSPGWNVMHKAAALLGVYKVAKAIQNETNAAAQSAYQACINNMSGPASTCSGAKSVTAAQAFNAVYAGIKFTWGSCNACNGAGGYTYSRYDIRFASLSGQGQNDMTRMVKNVVHELGHAFDWTHYDPDTKTRASNHMSADFTRNTVLRPNDPAGRWDWQQSANIQSNEVFADIFIAWTYDAWNTASENAMDVNAARDWMNSLVP